MLQAHLLRESVTRGAHPEAEAECDEPQHIVCQPEPHITREMAAIDFRVLAAWHVLQLVDAPILRMIDAQDRDAMQVGFVDAGRDAILWFERLEAFPRLRHQ